MKRVVQLLAAAVVLMVADSVLNAAIVFMRPGHFPAWADRISAGQWLASVLLVVVAGALWLRQARRPQP